MGKSLESTQNNALNQFRHAAMSNQHGKLESYLESSREKRKEFLEKRKNTIAEPAIKGFSLSKLAEIEASLEDKKKQKSEMIEKSVNNRNRHSLLNAALDVFGVHEIYDASTLKEFSKNEYSLLETENIKVSITVGRCLSSSIKLSVTVSTLKSFYTKADTFDIDGATTLGSKWVDETFKFTAKYGDALVFRRSLLPNLTKIIDIFNIDDENVRVLSEDIWSFDF